MTRQARQINTTITRNSMKLPELALELKRQKDAKRDFHSPSEELFLQHEGGGRYELTVGALGEFGVTDLFHDQLSAHYQIPKPYYQRIKADYPELLETTVNTHFEKKKEKRLVRTLDGNARAFLSNSYRPMDNVDLAMNAIIPAIGDVKDLMFDCQLTTTRMYIKAILPKIQGEVKRGDVVQAGVLIKNSEVGHSSLAIEPFINRLVCMNGLVMPVTMRKFHAGSRATDFEEAQELLLTDRTKMLRDAQLWSEVRDLITAVTTEKSFRSLLEPMKEAADRKLEAKPTHAVEVVAEWYGFDEEEQATMLDNLIKGGDMSHWGIVNAVTAMAHTEDDYDHATELQQYGGDILKANKEELKYLLTA